MHCKSCSHVPQIYKGGNNNCRRERENKAFILLLFVLNSFYDQNYALQGKENKASIIFTSFTVGLR
jgi:hypothetical protein